MSIFCFAPHINFFVFILMLAVGVLLIGIVLTSCARIVRYYYKRTLRKWRNSHA